MSTTLCERCFPHRLRGRRARRAAFYQRRRSERLLAQSMARFFLNGLVCGESWLKMTLDGRTPQVEVISSAATRLDWARSSYTSRT